MLINTSITIQDKYKSALFILELKYSPGIQ